MTPLGPRPLHRRAAPWIVEEVRAACSFLVGEAEPTPRALAAAGPVGERLELLRRDMARAAEGLAPTLGHLRRKRLVAWDPLTTLWECWDSRTGERLLVRQARPGVAPGELPRLGLGPEGTAAGVPFALSLADLLPVEAPDPAWVARVLGAVLRGLAAHGPQGLVHPELLVLGPAGWAWSVPGRPHAAPPPEEDDLRDLGGLAALLGEGHVSGFAEDPPPSVADALALFRAGLAESLTASRHALARRLRDSARHRRAARLRALAQRLETSVPPPIAKGCVQVQRDGLYYLVSSDGRRVWAGAVGTPELRHLAPVSDGASFDVAAARALQRAWRGRVMDTQGRRAAVQAAMGGDDAALARLLRWVHARLWLRTDRMLLEASS